MLAKPHATELALLDPQVAREPDVADEPSALASRRQRHLREPATFLTCSSAHALGSYYLVGKTSKPRFNGAQAKEVTMSSLNQQSSHHGTGSGYARWIAIAVTVAVVTVGVVLLLLYGGGGSAPGY